MLPPGPDLGYPALPPNVPPGWTQARYNSYNSPGADPSRVDCFVDTYSSDSDDASPPGPPAPPPAPHGASTPASSALPPPWPPSPRPGTSGSAPPALDTLRFKAWNARGLRPHFECVSRLRFEHSPNVSSASDTDITFYTETHLFPWEQTRLETLTSLCRVRTTSGGSRPTAIPFFSSRPASRDETSRQAGVCATVPLSWAQRIRQVPTTFAGYLLVLDFLHAPGGSPFMRVIGAYLPCCARLAPLRRDIEAYIVDQCSAATGLGYGILLLGDVNAAPFGERTGMPSSSDTDFATVLAAASLTPFEPPWDHASRKRQRHPQLQERPHTFHARCQRVSSRIDDLYFSPLLRSAVLRGPDHSGTFASSCTGYLTASDHVPIFGTINLAPLGTCTPSQLPAPAITPAQPKPPTLLTPLSQADRDTFVAQFDSSSLSPPPPPETSYSSDWPHWSPAW